MPTFMQANKLSKSQQSLVLHRSNVDNFKLASELVLRETSLEFTSSNSSDFFFLAVNGFVSFYFNPVCVRLAT